MKKIIAIATIVFLTACGGEDENYTTQDSLERLDNMNTTPGMMVDTANSMQQNRIDSMQQNSGGMDSIR